MSAAVDTRPAATGPAMGARAESVRGLLLLPVAIFVGVVYGLLRLIRRARPLASSARCAIEADGPLLTDVCAYAARFEAESMHERSGYGTKDFLMVYGRGGEPCRRCGAAIRVLRVGQRGTHVCPKCQRQTARASHFAKARP